MILRKTCNTVRRSTSNNRFNNAVSSIITVVDRVSITCMQVCVVSSAVIKRTSCGNASASSSVDRTPAFATHAVSVCYSDEKCLSQSRALSSLRGTDAKRQPQPQPHRILFIFVIIIFCGMERVRRTRTYRRLMCVICVSHGPLIHRTPAAARTTHVRQRHANAANSCHTFLQCSVVPSRQRRVFAVPIKFHN